MTGLPVTEIQLLITRKNHINFGNIRGLVSGFLSGSVRSDGIGIKWAFEPALVSQVVSFIVTQQVDMRMDMEHHYPPR